ncbi:MAG: hypothetical protein ACOCWM_06330, partial [Cyclobacteriaceae bacterium]
SRVDPDGRVDDDIYHNTKIGETKIVETNRADRLKNFLMIDRRIDLKGIASESIDSDDFVNKVISVFIRNENKFDFFLFQHFKNRIKNGLAELDANLIFNDNFHIDKVIPKENRKNFLRKLEEKTDLVMPRPVMSSLTFIIAFSLVLIPFIVIVYFSLKSVEFFIVTLIILTSGGLFLLFILLIITHFLCPNLLSSNDLPSVKTFSDFINEIVKINKHFYRINDFRLTKELLALQYKVIQYEKLS